MASAESPTLLPQRLRRCSAVPVAFFLSLPLGANAVAQNNIRNPTFNCGLGNYWLPSFGQDPSTHAAFWGSGGSDAGPSGSAVLYAGVGGGADFALFQRNIPVTPGGDYEFSAALRVDVPPQGSSRAFLRLRPDGGPTCSGPALLTIGPIPQGTPWTRFTMTANLSGTVCVEFWVEGSGSNPAYVLAHLDDVFLGPVGTRTDVIFANGFDPLCP